MVFNMKKLERINGEMVEQQSFIKLEKSPLKVYSKQLYPEEGLEVLYSEEKYGGYALINPNGFPWINLKLDPQGSTMRKGQHHTILDAGYGLFISILEHLFDKYEEKITSMVRNEGIIIWDGIPCWSLQINNPYFKYEDYTVLPDETLVTIAAKLKLSEYMILEHNKNILNYKDISPGQVIKIPNDYSSKIILLIDKIRMIPLVMKIYDDLGLYEQYEYTNVQLNPSLASNEFAEANKAYNF